jgi:hypothetical protein
MARLSAYGHEVVGRWKTEDGNREYIVTSNGSKVRILRRWCGELGTGTTILKTYPASKLALALRLAEDAATN